MLEKINRAIRLREAIRTTDTDALRVVDGAGDGFGGMAIDDFGGHWLVETKGGELPEELARLCESPGELARIEGAPPKSIYWKKLGDKESPVWIAGEKQERPFTARENGIKYWIDFNAGYSQGIFLDQRDNRLAIRNMARDKTVLNCFAYTCAFGVSAAAGGAHTVNVDLSKRYLEWGRRNYELNGIKCDPAFHDFIYGDAAGWLKRFYKRGRKFDMVILDPPTFSRNDKGEVFTIETGFAPLVSAAASILNPGGTIFCSTNQRSMTPSEFRSLVTSGLSGSTGWSVRSSPMPADFRGEPYLKSLWLKRGSPSKGEWPAGL